MEKSSGTDIPLVPITLIQLLKEQMFFLPAPSKLLIMKLPDIISHGLKLHNSWLLLWLQQCTLFLCLDADLTILTCSLDILILLN